MEKTYPPHNCFVVSHDNSVIMADFIMPETQQH